MAKIWEDFGAAVARARAARKYTLAELADVAFGNPDRKGYVSQIEKGRTALHLGTVQRLALALDLPDSVTDPVVRGDLPPDDVVAEVDRTAERLMRVSQADTDIAPPSEALLISLAYEFARGAHLDLMTAYNGLRAALQAAADLKALGTLPHNTSDQIMLVMRRVAELNDQGLRDEAAGEVDQAIAALDASHALQKAALTEVGIHQDRIRNAPEAAAKRLLAQLRAVAQPGGLFRALHDTWEEWFDRGHDKGVAFDLNVALHLARANLDRSKGVQRLQALSDLGITQGRLGEREGRDDRLKQSIATWRAFLEGTPRKSDPENWALGMNNLATVLQTLGEREPGTARLLEAVDAYGKVLAVNKRDRVPLDWAMTQNNLGNALRALGERESGTVRLEEAVTAYRAALEEYTRDRVPLNWAMTKNNLGTALRALGEREFGTARLGEAVTALRAALEERTRDCVPLEWAGTQNNLGTALTNLGEREPGTARLEEAVTAYRAALDEWTRDRVPLRWSMTQNNLGRALLRWGERDSGTVHLEQAIAAYRSALEEYTLDRVPLDWANSWGNMGEALMVLSDRTDDLAMARQALQQLEEAEAALRGGGHLTFADYMADRIPRAQAVITRLSQVGVQA